MKFLLFAPNFSHNSAGIRALYMLAEYLCDLGHDVYHANYQNPPLPPPAGSRLKYARSFSQDTIAIMPETCPIETPDIRVIRWALNHPGLLGGPKQYGANEFVIHWDGMAETAALASAHGVSHELTFGMIEPHTPSKKERILSLWYEGKKPSDNTHPEDALRLTRYWPPTREELFSLLDRTHSLYSYDDFTMLNLEARLRGVDVYNKINGDWKLYKPQDGHEKFIADPARDRANVAAMLDLFKAECQ